MVLRECMCLSPVTAGSTNEYSEIEEDKTLPQEPIFNRRENNKISNKMHNLFYRNYTKKYCLVYHSKCGEENGAIKRSPPVVWGK